MLGVDCTPAIGCNAKACSQMEAAFAAEDFLNIAAIKPLNVERDSDYGVVANYGGIQFLRTSPIALFEVCREQQQVNKRSTAEIPAPQECFRISFANCRI